jgi:HD-GYP domain-containing protein (c-di-GMP phosphodiesterase class II)
LHAGFKRRGHIVLAMLAVLFLVGIVPLATISWKLIGTNRETLTTAQQQVQVLVATSMAQQLDLHVEGLRTELLRVAQTLGAVVRRQGKIPHQEIRSVLAEVTGGRITYIRYSYFQADAVATVADGEYPEYMEPLFEATLRRAAEDHAGGVVGDPAAQTILWEPFLIEGDPPQAALAVAAPIRAGGRFRGVLTALVDLQAVWNAVALGNTTGHLLFALDEDGKVFASTDPEQARPGERVRGSEIVQRFLTYRGRGARRSTPFEIDRNGEPDRYIGTYEQTRQGWGIFVQARDEDIYWTVREMVRSTRLWELALLGIAGLAAIFFARTLSNPINKLAAASRALAQGDFSRRVQIGSKNEIGELAYTFNSMASEIESHIRYLKAAFEENNELFLGTILALAQAIDAKDPYTRGHSVRVNRYSMIISRKLGLSDDDLRNIHVSSLLHDVGKIGIDDSILRKTGQLTDGEFEIIKTHPVLGATIMAPIHQMKKIIPGLRYHHERADGSGYPAGLVGDNIPMMARIIAVADSFDAITTNRPYQDCMTFEQGRARINELCGKYLDTRVVQAFNRAYEEGLFQPGEGDEEVEALPAPPLPQELALGPMAGAVAAERPAPISET